MPIFTGGAEQNDGPAALAVGGGNVGSQLTQLLQAQEIVPGSDVGYQLCKTILLYHPLGKILARAPITRAQTKLRDLSCSVIGEKRILEQFNNEWTATGRIGATVLLHQLCSLSRTYGIATIGVGERGKDPSTPLDTARIAEADLFFNVWDPLNTSGSLVFNQDPNSPDFMKPTQPLRVQGQLWHPSRVFVKLNDDPIYIEWTNSAFGFVGQSVYQAALYPLKTFVNSMVTDDMVVKKVGLLVAKMVAPGSFIDNIMVTMFGWKRGQLKDAVGGQVLSIGITEDVQSLNLQNLEAPFKQARTDAIENIASAVGMPASIISHEAFNKGLAEGSEDAKKEAAYLDYIRQDMNPAYAFMDKIVMRKAWTKEFYETLKVDYPALRSKPFVTWLHECMGAFKATWPNLLVEPDSEKSKTQDVKMKAAIAAMEVAIPNLDPENLANAWEWFAANVNEMPDLFAGKLVIDVNALETHLESKAAQAEAAADAETQETKPEPFSKAS